MTQTPRWRQAFDAVDRAVAPHAESFVRTPGFSTGVAVLRRAQVLARSSAQGITARAWHLLNLPAGSDVSRLRAQIGALDREVRRLTVQLETERRSQTGTPTGRRSTTGAAGRRRSTETSDADGAQPADDPRPRPEGRGAQRPAGS
jgi:hypothetical protein